MLVWLCLIALPPTVRYTHVLAPNSINFQYQMKQEIKLKYFNADLKIGLVSWREAYLLSSNPKLLQIETYKGRLIYREKGSTRRISYNTLKKGLRKSSQTFYLEVPIWLSV
jgi:hypothetical protein